MSYIAIALGLLIGAGLASRITDYLLLAYYHRNCLKGDSYLTLYDFMDSDFNFDMMKGQKGAPKSYAEFLRLHERARSSAVRIFKANIKAILEYLSIRYLLLVVLPTVVFMDKWYLYFLPVIAIQVSYILYEKLTKDRGIDFYAILMQITVINEYQHKDK